MDKTPGNAKAPGEWQAHRPVLLLLLLCAGSGGPALAESPFPGQTFTYSSPPIDVETLTGGRENRANASHTIVVDDVSQFDQSRPSLIFFSTGNICVDSEVYPVIAVYRNDRWNTIPFPGARNHFWSRVYRDVRNFDLMYAMSSGHCGDPYGELYLYRSVDGGQSWTVSSVQIPHLSDFLSFRMEPDGTGEIVFEHTNDPDPVGGHYVYRTTDWGDNWSEPEFSENLLMSAGQRGGNATGDMIDGAAQDFLTALRQQPSIVQIMDDIAAEYERYR